MISGFRVSGVGRRLCALALWRSVFALCAITTLALSAPKNYARTQASIRAGVVYLASAHTGTQNFGHSAAPNCLYNLDKATQVKPIGWNIYNPNAPGQVSPSMVAEWTEVTGSDIPVAGAPIDKSKAEYWEVDLDQASDQQLSGYDFLVVNPAPSGGNFEGINPSEQEKLLKFVEQGGVLWIDPADMTVDPINNFPLAFTTQNSGGGVPFADPFDPLLTSPAPISASDLTLLHSAYQQSIAVANIGGLGSLDGGLPSQFLRYKTVTAVGGPTISVARIGEGAVVVTSTGVSQLLNRSAGTALGGNAGFTAATPALEADGLAAAKLAINMIYEGAEFSQPGGGDRKSGSSFVDVTAPVLTRWSWEGDAINGPFNPVMPGNSAVMYKGAMVVSSGNQLMVFNAVPGADLDGTGSGDEGVDGGPRDTSVGAPYDLIWNSGGTTMTAPLSAPVCVEVPDAQGNLPLDQVMVTDGAGILHVFAMFAKDPATGQLLGGAHKELYELTPPSVSGGYAMDSPVNDPQPQPDAPTVSENLAFIGDGTQYGSSPTGRVWIVDLTTGQYLDDNAEGSSATHPWYVGGSSAAGNPLAGMSAGPTIGYVTVQDNSGGYDKVVYGPGVVGQNQISTIESLWFGVKGETPPPNNIANNAGTITITTRAGDQGQLPIFVPTGGSPAQLDLAPKITFLDANGNPLSTAQVGTLGLGTVQYNSPAPGQITFTSSGWGTFNGGNGPGVRIDYTIDWGIDPAGKTSLIERGRLSLPQSNENDPQENRIYGNIAMSSQGTLVFGYGRAAPLLSSTEPSDLWWVKEDQGRGHFRVTGRFSFFGQHRITILNGQTYPAVFSNVDPLLTVAPVSSLFGSNLNTFNLAGPPVVLGNQAYALVYSQTPIAVAGNPVAPVMISMAFTADPATPKFTFSGLSPGFQLIQPDFERSLSQTQPEVLSSVGQGQSMTFDQTTGTLQINNLASVQNGQITDCLSLSQPVIVRSPSGGDQLVEPDATAGGTWTPLEWYCCWLGVGPNPNVTGLGADTVQRAPLVTGNTLFFAAESVVPSLLSGQWAGNGPISNAVVNAMDANISPSDSNVVQPLVRPWQNQVTQVSINSGQYAADPHIRMPQGSGGSFSGYVTRLLQTTLGTSTTAYSIAGGGNVVAAVGNKGVYGLSRADFLICDQGRLVRVDSAGNAIFATNSNLNAGPGSGGYAGNVTQLTRPTRAYPISQSEMLVVDAGGNRVVKLDNSGLEERAIDHFITDPTHLPAGYTANEPLTLKSPRDAITYNSYVTAAQNPLNNPQALEYWVHYLIADGGNKRLVELIDRYQVVGGKVGALVTVTEPDPNNLGQSASVPQAAVLWWQSPSNVSGKNFDYNSVSRVFLQGPGGVAGRNVYVAGIGVTQPSRAGVGLDNPNSAPIQESGTGNGGVVVFDPQSPTGVQVYDVFEMPSLAGTPLYDPVASQTNGTPTYDTNSPYCTPAQTRRPLSGVMAVSAKAVLAQGGAGLVAIMVSSHDGVFEFTVDPTTTSDDLGGPDWFINNAAYTSLHGLSPADYGTNANEFLPGYARRLDSGEVLLVNSYTGVNKAGAPYKGEVLMFSNNSFNLSQANLGFNAASVHFQLPTITGVRDLVAPVFADRR